MCGTCVVLGLAFNNVFIEINSLCGMCAIVGKCVVKSISTMVGIGKIVVKNSLAHIGMRTTERKKNNDPF